MVYWRHMSSLIMAIIGLGDGLEPNRQQRTRTIKTNLSEIWTEKSEFWPFCSGLYMFTIRNKHDLNLNPYLLHIMGIWNGMPLGF